MPWQPGIMGNHVFMGKQGMMGKQGLIGNQGFIWQKIMMGKPPPIIQRQFDISMNSMNFCQKRRSSNALEYNIKKNAISDVLN